MGASTQRRLEKEIMGIYVDTTEESYIPEAQLASYFEHLQSNIKQDYDSFADRTITFQLSIYSYLSFLEKFVQLLI